MLWYVYVSAMCPCHSVTSAAAVFAVAVVAFFVLSIVCAVIVKAEIVGVELRHPLSLSIAVPGSNTNGNADMPPTLMSALSPQQLHRPRPSLSSSLPFCSFAALAAAVAIVVVLL